MSEPIKDAILSNIEKGIHWYWTTGWIDSQIEQMQAKVNEGDAGTRIVDALAGLKEERARRGVAFRH